MDSNLEILISAVDEASGTIAEVGDSVAAMADEVSGSMEVLSDSTQEFADEFFASWNAASEAVEGYANAMQISIDQVMADMEAYGISAQQAADEIVAANSRISTSATTTAEATGMSAGAFAGLAAIAGIAFLAIKGGISDAVEAAQQWDETSAGLNEVLKDTESSIPLSAIQAYAVQLQQTTLFGQNDILTSESMILSHRNLQTSYQQTTVMAADLATKMGTDLPSATKILTNALADPVAGLNQLIRQGNIDFPAAAVTMIQNLAKAGDTAGADAVIMQTLQGSIGGMSQAAASAPGAALTQLQNSMTSLGIAIGNDLLPLLDKLAQDMEPIITDVIAWTTAHPKLTDAIVLGAAALAGLLLLIGLVGVAIITVTPVVEAIGVVIAALSAPIWGIAALLVVLAAAVYFNWNLIKTDTETIWTYISEFIKDIWSTIQNTVKTGVDYVISAINGFINALDAIKISIPSISIPGTKLATPAINLGFSIPDIPMLAAGGFVTQPTLALIGEAGPEAVVPLSAMGGVGAQGQQIVINIQGGNYLDATGATMIGNALAKQIIQQIRVRNYQP